MCLDPFWCKRGIIQSRDCSCSMKTNVIELGPFYHALIQKVHLGFKSDFWARNPNTSHSEAGGRMVDLDEEEIVEMQMG